MRVFILGTIIGMFLFVLLTVAFYLIKELHIARQNN